MKYYAGIDLGGTKIATGVVDENFRFIASHSVPTGKHRSFEVIVADMASATLTVIEQAGRTLDDFDTIGIGVPCSQNPKNGRPAFANNLGWKNVPIVEEFRKHIDKTVRWANDADCAALGEALAGTAKQYGSMLFITLGTGIGGGLILNGKIFTGGDGAGIEPGHSTLILDGFPCTCGRRGCFESYGSITGLIRQTIEAIAADPHTQMREICGNDITRVNGRTAFDAAKMGDPSGQKVVDEYVHYVGSGISSLVSVFRPHAVLIGGGISNEGEYLLTPIRRVVDESMFAKGVLETPIVMKASLGSEAGIIGAALLETQNDFG